VVSACVPRRCNSRKLVRPASGDRMNPPPVHGPSRRLNSRRLVVLGAPSAHLAHPARRAAPTTSRLPPSVSVPYRGYIVSSSPYATGALLSSVLSLHRPSLTVSRHPSVCPAGVTSCRHHRMPREPSFRRVHIFASVLSMHRPSPPAIRRFTLVVPHSVPPPANRPPRRTNSGVSPAHRTPAPPHPDAANQRRRARRMVVVRVVVRPPPDRRPDLPLPAPGMRSHASSDRSQREPPRMHCIRGGRMSQIRRATVVPLSLLLPL
jgi:hypothetical protein